MLHKGGGGTSGPSEEAEDQPEEDLEQEHQDDSKEATERETGEGDPAVPLRRSARKQQSEHSPQDRAFKVRARFLEAIETGRTSEAISVVDGIRYRRLWRLREVKRPKIRIEFLLLLSQSSL